MTFERSKSRDLYQPVEYKHNFSKSKKHWFLKCKKTGNHLFLKKMFSPGSKNFVTWFCFFFFLYSWSSLFTDPLFSLQSPSSMRDKK